VSLKDEVKSYGKDTAKAAGAAAAAVLLERFISWVRTRPVKRLIERRKAKKNGG
jgi:hypothetical protein